MKTRDDSAEHFRVNGAGELQVGRTDQDHCGGEDGVSIGVSWGGHGYAGGVLPNHEVDRLIAHLQSLRCPDPVELVEGV